MHDEGVPVIAIPKTMDNDVHGTDYCIGFSTAVTRGVQFIHNLRTSTGSHERIAVVELFGRYSGETSLITAYLAGVDRARDLRGARSTSTGSRELLVARQAREPVELRDGDRSPRAPRSPGGEMVLSGEADAYGHRKLGGIGELTAQLLKERTGEDIIYQQLGYLMRSGSPDSLDLMVATNYAVMAADLALEGAHRTHGRAPQRHVHVGSDRRHARGRQARRRRRALRRAQYRPKVRHVTGKPMFLY